MKGNDISESISDLVDDRLDTAGAMRIFTSLAERPDAAAKYSRYLLIGEVLRSRQPVACDPAFAARVHRALEQEPAILAPDWRQGLRDRGVTLALAATLAGLAVLVGASVFERREAVPLAVADGMSPERMQDYLVTHNETGYLAANGGLMPYLRVVSSDRTGR